ncbi:hypothetical protein Y600_6052 [Burkholderia pseudomallei MSHR3709]|nr:hypothetical protein Y600_6052 [Burkholderia pseudomallei MSHR3709]
MKHKIKNQEVVLKELSGNTGTRACERGLKFGWRKGALNLCLERTNGFSSLKECCERLQERLRRVLSEVLRQQYLLNELYRAQVLQHRLGLLRLQGIETAIDRNHDRPDLSHLRTRNVRECLSEVVCKRGKVTESQAGQLIIDDVNFDWSGIQRRCWHRGLVP